MSNILELAQQTLLEPTGLILNDLDKVMDKLLRPGVDIADIYFESTRVESWMLEDGIIKEGAYNIDQGVGLRAVSGEKTGFAYTDDILLETMLEAGQTASAIAKSGHQQKVAIQNKRQAKSLYAAINPLDSMSEEDKISLMHRLDQEARKQDPRIQQVIVSLVSAHDTMMVLNNEGTLASDIRPLIRCSIQVIAEEKGRREQASAGGGSREGFQFFIDEERALGYAREAARQALVNLSAKPAPAGSMTVVLGPGWPGILLHEAIGHGLEGDFNRKGSSAFSGCVGQKVAVEGCTVVDNGTLENRRGSLSVDDEGTPSQNTVLIENGILKGYMQDRMNAGLMGSKSTGNGRRESYAHIPMPRMTNTYMLPGQHDPDEIIASVKDGLYAVNFAGGQVDITSGKFVFSASEAYMIKNGKLSHPVKGATLIGDGPQVLTQIDMIGNDLELDSGVGTCGKEGQSVPVGVGQPTLKINNLTVGGTQ